MGTWAVRETPSGVGSGVGVSEGVKVGDGVDVAAALGVRVGDRMGLAVAVRVGVRVGDEVNVAVGLSVAVRLGVGVPVPGPASVGSTGETGPVVSVLVDVEGVSPSCGTRNRRSRTPKYQ